MSLIILDRDGVINFDSDDHIKHPDEWRPIPGSLEAIARLYQAGYHVVVASNQSGLARGLFDIETLNHIHAKMLRLVTEAGGHIDGIFFCPHHPDEGCACRKPQPGLLYEIANRFSQPLDGIVMVGDSQRDLDAARAAGAEPVLVCSGKLDGHDEVPAYDDLAAFTDEFLRAR